MEISRGTAYMVGLAQVAVTLAVVLCFPAVHVQIYTCHPVVLNGTTSLAEPAPLHGTSLMMGLPMLAVSALAVLFTTTTMHLADHDLLKNDYAQDTLEMAGLWDPLFWAFCTLAHVVLVLLVTTPADAFATALGGLLLAYFIQRACRPKSKEINLTQENLNILGYSLGVLVAAYSAQPGSARLTALFVAVVLDYFLGVGHTWDRQATLDTITNCRMFYVCATSMCMAALYGAWEDRLLNAE